MALHAYFKRLAQFVQIQNLRFGTIFTPSDMPFIDLKAMDAMAWSVGTAAGPAAGRFKAAAGWVRHLCVRPPNTMD